MQSARPDTTEMNAQASQPLIFPEHLPAAIVFAAALAGIVAWFGIRRLASPRRPPARVAFFCARAFTGFLALVAAADAAQRFVIFATNWPIPAVLAATALAVEAVVSLYGEERSAAQKRSAGLMVSARVALVLAIGAMLCQPVLVFETERKIERTVAILLDRSASMQVQDRGLTPSEKLRIAEFLSGGKIRRKYAPERAAEELLSAQKKLRTLAVGVSALSGLPAEERDKRFDAKARATRDSIRTASEEIVSATNILSAALPEQWIGADSPIRKSIAGILGRIENSASVPLKESLDLLDSLYARERKNEKDGRPSDYLEKLIGALNRASSGLLDIQADIAKAGRDVDEAWWLSLPEEKRAEIDRMSLLSRYDLAREILLRAPAAGANGKDTRSFLESLRKSYTVRLYTFDSETSPATEKTLSETNSVPTGTDPFNEAGALGTDIASALEFAGRDVPAERLSSVIILTDGRHNARSSPETVAQALASRQTPVHCVMLGAGAKPPPDAGFLAVDAPDTVYTNDRVLVAAEIKLDGLQGSNALVTLYRNDSLVASSVVAAASESVRAKANLADMPGTNGMHVYRLELQRFDGEVTFSNNTATVCVTVMDEKTKLLVVEGWPRWEYRFIKNLFETRDPSVLLQQVLIHPDPLAGVPALPPVHASAARPPGETEATALPETAEEWMKFDAVILGDVSPEDLGDAGMAALRRFVIERGGTLAVIAGPRHMPHFFGGTPLAELLPVSFAPDTRPCFAGPEDSFRIALTAEGRNHVLTRLAAEGESNDAIWNGLPDIRWRHGGVRAKEGARVLAYAVAPDARGMEAGAVPAAIPTEEALRRREEYERTHPLIVVHNAGMGRVVFLAFDHAWRLRYRAGDLYHHRLWGQILRWGGGEKLAYGTPHARLGTGKSRYQAGEPVRISARLSASDWSPINDARVSVDVVKDGKVALRKTLARLAGSAGLYSADVGALPPGEYRVDLDCRGAGNLPEAENTGKISAWFSVARDFPHELGELAADTGFLKRIADLSGGKAVEPDRIGELLPELGEPSASVRELIQKDLWNGWPLLALIAALAGCEWVIRKKAGLP